MAQQNDMTQQELVAGIRAFAKEHQIEVLQEMPEEEMVPLLGRSKRLMQGGALWVVMWRLTGKTTTKEQVEALGGVMPERKKKAPASEAASPAEAPAAPVSLPVAAAKKPAAKKARLKKAA